LIKKGRTTYKEEEEEEEEEREEDLYSQEPSIHSQTPKMSILCHVFFQVSASHELHYLVLP
jgi:hypothetical protein